MALQIKEALKKICSSDEWCYSVLWQISRRDFMLLMPEDACYDESSRLVVEKMFTQFHMFGEGIIGQAAFTGTYQWVFLDTYCRQECLNGNLNDQDVSQGISEWHLQLSSGIKTVVAIPVASDAVILCGSSKKVLERSEFADHVKSLFKYMKAEFGLYICPSSDTQDKGNNERQEKFSSSISPESCHLSCPTLKSLQNYSCDDPILKNNPSFVYSPTPGNCPISKSSMHYINNANRISFPESQVLSSMHYSHSQASLKSNLNSDYFVQNTNAKNSSWGRENYTPSTMEQPLLSDTGIDASSSSMNNGFGNFHGSLNSNTSNPLGVALGNSRQNQSVVVDRKKSSFDTVEGKLSSMDLCNNGSSVFDGLSKESSTLCASLGDLTSALLGVPYLSQSSMVSHWPTSPVENADGGLTTSGNIDILQDRDCNSISCPIDPSTMSCNGKEKYPIVAIQTAQDSDLFDMLDSNYIQQKEQKRCDGIVLPLGSATLSNLSTENLSELDESSGKSFLSDFELQQILDSVSGCDSPPMNLSDGLNKIMMNGTDDSQSMSNMLMDLSCLTGIVNVLPSKYDLGQGISKPKDEIGLNHQVNAWIDSSYAINSESSILQPKRLEEPSKVMRKRAKPGESSRTRPKDRQQIQDRVKELREIVPNGAKCSIDALLDRTIKHMLFLQSITKHADKLKIVDEPKIISRESVVLKDNPSSGCGATWAFEAEGQNMVCPIIVEDLNPPGQMLLEMICEDRGFFLEIVDIIRSFGLTILKGLMETREDNKIWARFVVEANGEVTRMDIFLSLVQLLQQISSNPNSTNQLSNVIDGGASLPIFPYYPQSSSSLPIGVSEGLK